MNLAPLNPEPPLACSHPAPHCREGTSSHLLPYADIPMQTRGILRDPSLPTPTPDLPSVLLSLSQRSSHHYSSHAPRLQLCPGSSPSEPTRVSSPTQISPPAPGLLPQVHYSLSFWPSSSISSKKSYLIPLAGDNTPSLQHAVNSLVQRRLQGMEMHRTVNE